jgi:ADP-ribosyl-[dinitrogen reductase] hydrolase
MGQQDRMAGTLLGMAAGDALGAGYEFEKSPRGEIGMIGGGLGDFAPGEWTDDTSMAVCIAQVTATGAVDLDAIGERFLGWQRSGPADIGVSTGAVLRRARSASDLPTVAASYFDEHPKGAAGNGALMRTAPVALAHLGDDAAIAVSARSVAELTHADPLAGDSCVLWCIAIDRAIRDGRLDGVHDGLVLIPTERREFWADAIAQAEQRSPRSFAGNGFTVTALQAAYAAIIQTPLPDEQPAQHLQDALREAVRIGNDTDTVAAIAGMVLGARWGASAIPARWRRMLHGWPGLTGTDLVRLAVLTVQGGQPDASGWPGPTPQRGYAPAYLAELPGDHGVVLGNLASLEEATGRVDAVVSLCRVGTGQVPSHLEHHEVLLIDRGGEDDNPNLGFVLTDTVTAITELRASGKRVFVHCVDGRSRTPTVAASYLATRDGISGQEAWQQIAALLPNADTHNTTFQQWLTQLAPATT